MTPYSRITGTGSYLPPRRVTNDDLASELAARGIETSDQWIIERTGIRARHFADAGRQQQRPRPGSRPARRWKPPAAAPLTST